MCDTFDLTSLIKANICFNLSHQTSIDVILAKSGVITTGLSDCHKMVLIFFHSYFSRLLPKTITCRSFRYFETKYLLYKLENKLRTTECNRGVKYDDLTKPCQTYATKTKASEGKSSSFYDKRTEQSNYGKI